MHRMCFGHWLVLVERTKGARESGQREEVRVRVRLRNKGSRRANEERAPGRERAQGTDKARGRGPLSLETHVIGGKTRDYKQMARVTGLGPASMLGPSCSLGVGQPNLVRSVFVVGRVCLHPITCEGQLVLKRMIWRGVVRTFGVNFDLFGSWT